MAQAGKRSVPGRIHVRLSRLSFIPGGNRFAHLVAAALLICDGANQRAIAWLFLPQYRKLALRNVRIAFGDELSETEMRRIVRRHFQQLGANLLCSVKFTRM